MAHLNVTLTFKTETIKSAFSKSHTRTNEFRKIVYVQNTSSEVWDLGLQVVHLYTQEVNKALKK